MVIVLPGDVVRIFILQVVALPVNYRPETGLSVPEEPVNYTPELASLRDRKEDIPLLVEFFLGRTCASGGSSFQISKRAMQCLLAYHWPGNIRELQNVIERGVILAENNLITEHALPRELADAYKDTAYETPFLPLAKVEKEHIFRVLRYVDDNRAKAAEILGISRKTLYRKLKGY